MERLRISVTAAIGAVGGFVSTAFGGWTSAMTTLIIFMAVDYITGLMTAGIFKRSKRPRTAHLKAEQASKGFAAKA